MAAKQAEYYVAGNVEIRAEALLPFNDPSYSKPTPEEIRAALAIGGLSAAQARALLGVTEGAIRKWTGGEQAIPYAAWRLLSIYTKLVRPDMMGIDPLGRRKTIVTSLAGVGKELQNEFLQLAEQGEQIVDEQLRRADLLASEEKVLHPPSGEIGCPYCFVLEGEVRLMKTIDRAPDRVHWFRCMSCERELGVDVF